MNVVVRETEHYAILMTLSKLAWIWKKFSSYFFEKLSEVLEEFTDVEEAGDLKGDNMEVDTGMGLSALQRDKVVFLISYL